MRGVRTEMARAVKEVETWYEAVPGRGAARQERRGNGAADVCVVGGGLAGLTVACELSRYGKRVALVEAKRLAWGASGRMAGSSPMALHSARRRSSSVSVLKPQRHSIGCPSSVPNMCARKS